MNLPASVARAVSGWLLAAALAVSAGAQSRPAAESQPAAEAGPSGSADDFAPLFRYLPAQLESLMCLTSSRLTDNTGEFKWSGQQQFAKDRMPRFVRSLHAGRKFGEEGDYEGVSVFEVEKPIGSLADVLNEDAFTYAKVAGVGCFVRKPPNDEEFEPFRAAETWVAVADKKYLLFATRRALLQEALLARGPHASAALEAVGWTISDVDWTAPMVIARRYDPKNTRDTTSPAVKPAAGDYFWPPTRGFQIERILASYDPKKRAGRISVATKDSASALKYLRELLGDPRHGVEGANDEPSRGKVDPAGSTGDVHAFTISYAGKDREHGFDWDPSGSVLALFGHWGYR